MTVWTELSKPELETVKARLEQGMQATVDAVAAGAQAHAVGQLYGMRLSLLAQVEDELYAREQR